MKKRWLICLSAVLMALALCFGIVACGGEEDGKSDADKAKEAIHTIKVLYEGKNTETNDDYEVFGQVKGDGVMYDVVWTVSSTSVDDIETYVKIGKMDESTKQLTIDITRATFDIEYTLKASVTVGSATESAEFPKKIAKKSSEEAVTASLDFTDKANRTKCDTDNNEQVWSQNGITLTNTGNVADYVPIRLYKNTPVTIEMENAKIVHIDFHSASAVGTSNYPEYLKTSLEGANLPIKGEIAVSEDGLTLSVDFETPLETVTFTTTTGQCRLTSIDVEGNERDPNEHVHKWTYEHIANTWTHKATCTAEGCDVNTKTENCTPKLNVCECGYTYSAKEIVDALFALEKDQSLPGTYTLTGEVIAVTELDTAKFFNVTFTMTVEGQTVTVYRAKGAHYSEVEAGGTATVNGSLLDYNGTKEFTQGASVVEFVPGVDDRTPQQKVDAALAKLDSTFTVTKAGATDLPASTVRDVTFTWSTTDQTYPIANNKITVSALPETDATVTATVTASCGAESVTNNTRQVTITIKAQGSTPTPSEGDGSKDSPFTVSQALEIINGLESYAYYTADGADPVPVYVQGIVTVAGTSDNYGIKNYYIADAAGDTENDVLIYSLNWSTAVASGTKVEVGDTILIQAYLQNYNGTPEITYWREGTTGSYTYHDGYIEGHTPAGGTVTPPTPGGDDTDADATLSFADDANRSSITSETDIWTQNNVTLTQNKGSGSDIDTSKSYFNPLRIYKNHVVTIEYTSAMAKIVFHCATYQENDYASALKTSLESVAGVTVTVDGTVVTVVLDTPSTSFEFTNTSGQVRLDSIDVYTTAGGGDVGGDTHTCEHVCDICGKCTDESCDDPACADKCEGHTLADTEFTTTDIETLKGYVSESGKTTTEKYFAIGIVKSIKDDYNSEIYIVDEEGNELYVYRLLSEDGSEVYQAPSGLFSRGDTIVVYGVMTNYNGTIEMQYAWLVQINSTAKTDEAKLLLLTVSLPAVVDKDFDLPVVEGVTYAVQSGDGIAIQGNKATVTRTDDRQEVVIRATASVNTKTAIKDFTVVVKQTVTDSEEISVTDEQLLAGQSSNAYSASGSNPVDCYMFSWTDVGNYGWIQMRKTKPSSFWNTDAFALPITKVEITWASKQGASTDNLKIELSNNKDFTDAQSVTVSAVVGQKAEVTATGEDCVFIRVTQNGNYAVYIEEVKIICAKQTVSPQPDTDDEKAQRALDELDIPETLTEDYTLSESTVAGVELKFTAESHDAIEIAEGGVKLTVTRPEATADDVTGTVTVTATINGVTKTKVFTITVEKKQAATDPTEQSGSYTIQTDSVDESFTTTYASYQWSVEGTSGTLKGTLFAYKVAEGMQFNAGQKAAYIANTEPTPAPISKITITTASGKNVRSWKLLTSDVPYFVDGVNPTAGTDRGTKSAETTGASWELADSNDHFFALVLTDSGASVISSIVVEYAGTPITDEDRVSMTVNGLNVETMLEEDYTLPTTTLANVQLTWTIENGGEAAKLDETNKIIKVVRQNDNVEFTLKVTAQCGTATSEPRSFTVTVKALPKAGEDVLLYTLDTSLESAKGKSSSYTGNGDVTVGDVTWNVEGNNTMNPWRLGGKKDKNAEDYTVDRAITGKTAISGKVTKILLTITDSGSITINSITLKVYSSNPLADDADSEPSPISTKTISYSKGVETTVEAGDENWTNCYYQIVFNVTITNTSNKYVALETMKFMGPQA